MARAAGQPAIIVPALRDFAAMVGIERAELDAFAAIVAQLDPQLLGTWVEAMGDIEAKENGAKENEVDCGWYLPQEIALSTALTVAKAAARRAKHPAKCRRGPAPTRPSVVCAWRRPWLAPGNPFVELRIALPGKNVDDRVMAGVRLFDVLGVVDLPDEVLGVLLNATSAEMAVSLWFTPGGVVKTALMVAHPQLDLTLALFRMATAAQQPADYAPGGATGQFAGGWACLDRSATVGQWLWCRIALSAPRLILLGVEPRFALLRLAYENPEAERPFQGDKDYHQGRRGARPSSYIAPPLSYPATPNDGLCHPECSEGSLPVRAAYDNRLLRTPSSKFRTALPPKSGSHSGISGKLEEGARSQRIPVVCT